MAEWSGPPLIPILGEVLLVFDPGGEAFPSVKQENVDNDLDLVTDSLACLQLLASRELMNVGPSLNTLLSHAWSEAVTELGTNIVYDEALFDSLDLKDFLPDHYLHNDSALETESLDTIIER